jgi:predicted CoA-binding protein
MKSPTGGVEYSTMEDIATLLTKPDTTVAVVGASDDPDKYGAVVYRDLKAKGFTVFAVNPNRDEVDGDPSYPSLAALPEKPTIVDFVVPPPVTLGVLHACLDLGLTNVWIQPGAESPAVLAFVQEHEFNYMANACIMVQSRLRGRLPS